MIMALGQFYIQKMSYFADWQLTKRPLLLENSVRAVVTGTMVKE